MLEVLLIIFFYFLCVAVPSLGLFFYVRAVISRKTYHCPECGEIVRVELMHATHCNTCGAPLNLQENLYD